MEDYAVFAAAHELEVERAGAVKDINLVRYDCDPNVIPHAAIDDHLRWAKESHYSAKAYVDAIIWGFGGGLVDKIPASAVWTLPVGPELAFHVPKDGKEVTIDPYLAEIATDFLPDTAKNQLFGTFKAGEVDKGEFSGILSKRFTDDMPELLRKKLRVIRKFFRRCLTKPSKKLRLSLMS